MLLTQLRRMPMNVNWMTTIIEVIDYHLDDLVIVEHHCMGIYTIGEIIGSCLPRCQCCEERRYFLREPRNTVKASPRILSDMMPTQRRGLTYFDRLG